MKIGVLALQGDFAEHIVMLKRLKVETAEVRLPEHLKSLDGLIIPGGESTTIGKLATDLWPDRTAAAIRPASCHLGNLCRRDLSLEGCQAQPAPAEPDGYHGRAQRLWPAGRFVRGRPGCARNETGNRNERPVPCDLHPRTDHRIGGWRMQRSWPTVADGRIVAAQQGHLLATSFHPELTQDTRFHEYFLSLAD